MLFKKEEKPQVFEIKQFTIEKPKDDECIIFVFPEDAPKELINRFDALLVEFINSERPFITTNLKVDFRKVNKSQIQTEDDKSN